MYSHFQIKIKTGKHSDSYNKYDQSYRQLQQKRTATWTKTLKSENYQDL